MNIDTFKSTNTSLHKFLDFCKQAEQEGLKVIYHDWDNMCGIEVQCLNDVAVFNFYGDGSFRGLIDSKDIIRNF